MNMLNTMIQQLRDEVARLKDEKVKPKILPNVPDIPRDKPNHQVGKSYVFSWPASRLAFGDYSILSVPKLPVSS